MYFIAIACGVNIVLDYIFMGALHLGPSGAALGTTLSQTVSVIVALTMFIRGKTGITVKKDDFKPRKETMGRLLKIGFPYCHAGWPRSRWHLSLSPLLQTEEVLQTQQQ